MIRVISAIGATAFFMLAAWAAKQDSTEHYVMYSIMSVAFIVSLATQRIIDEIKKRW